MAFHGHPRATKALDVLVRAAPENARLVYADGASFEVEGRKIPVIGLAALLKNKREAGRPQDLADVAALEARKASPAR